MYLPSQNKEHCIVLYCIVEIQHSLSSAHYEVSLSVKLFFLEKNLKGLSYLQVNNNFIT